MKKLVFIPFLVFVFSCGGSGGGGGAFFDMGLELPPEMSGLDAGSLKLYGSLLDGDTAGPEVLGEVNGDRYGFDFGGAADNKYIFRIVIKYSFDGAEFSVAVAEKEVLISSGSVTVEISETDFTDIGGDDTDSDGLNNLSEILLGLDPMLSDSDGDGVLDGSDIFPAASSEWLDTDLDGIGNNSDDDVDGDGLTNEIELSLGTDPYDSDSDDDGVDDLNDNCRLWSNGDQIDIDGDGGGDLCDGDRDGDGLTDGEEIIIGTDPSLSDTDGDGLSDNIEKNIGSDPLKIDTDDDGYSDGEDLFPLDSSDWHDRDNDGVGDNNDNCPDKPNNGQANADGDVFGNACDDDIDGDGNPYVYVDQARGDDLNLGIYRAPVKTIGRGVVIAYERNESVVVAGGSYDIASVVFKNGVDLKGGYDGSEFSNPGSDIEDHRDIRSDDDRYLTELYNSSASTTLYLNDSHGAVRVEGFHIINSGNAVDSSTVKLENAGAGIVVTGNTISCNVSADISRGIFVAGGTPRINANWIEKAGSQDGVLVEGILAQGGSPTIVNNIVRAGRARHTVAMRLSRSSAIVVNNTLDGTSLANFPATSSALVFEDSSPMVVNNILISESQDGVDAVVMKCFGDSPDTAEFRNNILSTFTNGTSDALVVDCEGRFYYTEEFQIGGSLAGGNLSYFGGRSSLVNSSYGLAGTMGVDQGFESHQSEYGAVLLDFDMNERNSYDIGAKEKM